MIIDGNIFPYKRKINVLFQVAQSFLKEDFSKVNVSLNFVDEAEIQKLNKDFRNIDKSTDVLSFPNLEKDPTQKLKRFEKERDENGILFLGDIVICKKIAYLQAEEYGHSKKREVCFLALHGLLHLLGFDHIKPEDEKKMMKVTDEILKNFGAKR